MEIKPFKLPENFLLGTATAASQIEGVSKDTNWYVWAEDGNTKDGSFPVPANDHWNRLEEDTKLLADLGVKTHRLSLEWSRIEPETGKFDREGLEHYRKEIGMLIDRGIVPLVTLHHFSNPVWFEKSGGWSSEGADEVFARFASEAVSGLGDLVSDWVTINEPNVYLILGHMSGIFPPGHKRWKEFMRGSRNMISAHNQCYDFIHRNGSGKEPMVGASHHVRLFDPASKGPLNRGVSRLYDRLGQDMFIRGMTDGKLVFPLGSGKLWGDALRSDFLGLNYYTRDVLAFKFSARTLFTDLRNSKDAPVNDLGWEIYPEGLSRLVRKYFNRYKLPVWITENGTCDGKDAFRAKFIYDHLRETAGLIDEGCNVERYYHWTFIDNFEWNEGETAPFGLYALDFETQERTLRESGKFFAEICKNSGVTQGMIERYL